MTRRYPSTGGFASWMTGIVPTGAQAILLPPGRLRHQLHASARNHCGIRFGFVLPNMSFWLHELLIATIDCHKAGRGPQMKRAVCRPGAISQFLFPKYGDSQMRVKRFGDHSGIAGTHPVVRRARDLARVANRRAAVAVIIAFHERPTARNAGFARLQAQRVAAPAPERKPKRWSARQGRRPPTASQRSGRHDSCNAHPHGAHRHLPELMIIRKIENAAACRSVPWESARAACPTASRRH